MIGRLAKRTNRKNMRHQKFTPRADYRLAESLRANASVSLSEKFPELQALTVEFAYFSPEGPSIDYSPVTITRWQPQVRSY